MSLSNLKEFDIPEDKIGYKVFIKKAPGKFSSVYKHPQRTRIEGVEYHDEEDERILAHSGKPYRNGFHIFTSFDDALNYAERTEDILVRDVIIRRVAFDNVVATGIQFVFPNCSHSGTQGLKTIVARTMTILRYT